MDQHPIGFLVVQQGQQPKGPEILQYIQQQGDRLILQEQALADLHYAMYGPVLVEAQCRGHGIAKRLYQKARQEMKEAGFNAFVAFVDVENPKSLRIHIEGLGMEVIDKVVLQSGQFFIIGQIFR